MTVDVCIIGAGISGLTAGLLLVQKGLDVCIVDAQNRVGGRIQTDVVEGYLCDRGFKYCYCHIHPHGNYWIIRRYH